MPEQPRAGAVLQPIEADGSADVTGWRVVADLDVASETRARGELAAAISRCSTGGHRWFLLHFDEVFVDVRGTAVLLHARELAAAAGCRLAVVAPPASLCLIWEALHLDGAVPLLRSQVEARMLIESEHRGRRA